MEDKIPEYLLTLSDLQAVLPFLQNDIDNLFKGGIYKLSDKKIGFSPTVVRRFFENFGADYSFKVVSHINMRGGCDKTTATISLASRAKAYGHKVCILDLDSQASSTHAFKVDRDPEKVFVNVYKTPSKNLQDVLIKIDEGQLSNNGPSMRSSVVSSICASDVVVVPVYADEDSLRGVEVLITEILRIEEAFGNKPPTVRILFSKYDGRDKLSADYFASLTKDKILSKLLIHSSIRTNVSFPRSIRAGKTVFAGFENNTAREDYDTYTKYIIGINNLEHCNK